MNKEVIGFGIIGCGMVSEWHAKAILEISGAKLVGVTDTLEKSRLEFAKRFNTLAFGSVDELLENPEIGVVCICTPSGLHAPFAIKAANAGKHIVVEKPMALNLTVFRKLPIIIEKINENYREF